MMRKSLMGFSYHLRRQRYLPLQSRAIGTRQSQFIGTLRVLHNLRPNFFLLCQTFSLHGLSHNIQM